MEEKGEGKQLQAIDRTEELFVAAKNECPVTGLPYETPEMRRGLLGVLEKAIKNKDIVLLLYGELDKLKGLNDVFKDHGGDKKADEGINKFVGERKGGLTEIEGLQILIYRPRAGGMSLRL